MHADVTLIQERV